MPGIGESLAAQMFQQVDGDIEAGRTAIVEMLRTDADTLVSPSGAVVSLALSQIFSF
jgi:hypothetical protein